MGSLLLGNEDQRNQFDLQHYGQILDDSGNPVDPQQAQQGMSTQQPQQQQMQPQMQPQQMDMKAMQDPSGGLNQLMGQNGPGTGFGSPTLGMAGILMASGVPPSKALQQASQMQTQMASGRDARSKQDQMKMKQQAIQMLGQETDPVKQKQILYSGAFDPSEIAKFAELTGAGNNIVNGANGIKYTQSKDPNTGQIRLDVIPGQLEKPPIMPAEARINNNKITKLAEEANSAERENRYLDDADKYFAKFDKAQGVDTLTGAGGFIARNAPKQLDNALLSKEGQGAKQEIDKISGLIFQNRVIGAGANATDAFKEQVKKSLPTIELTPDARQELIETKRRENMATLTRSKFLSEWYKQNSKDIAGAEDAYQSYIDGQNLLTNDGQVNKGLLKEIPSVVTDFIGKSSQPIHDNRTTRGGGNGGDNIDAMYANPNGSGAVGGQTQLGVPQSANTSGKKKISDLSYDELVALSRRR